MGFSGGGTNVLKPHKHSSAVQDGSPLNMNNVTEATLSAGDVIFSDGAALQRLAIGTPAQQIKVNAGATAPEYFTPAAAASDFALIAEQTTPGTSIDTTALSDCDNYSRLLFIFAFENDTTAPLEFQWYDESGVILTPNYQLQGFTNGALFSLSPSVASLQLSNSVNIGTEGVGGIIEVVNRRLPGGHGGFGRASWYSDLNGGMCAFDNKGYGTVVAVGPAVQGFKMLNPVTFDNAVWTLYGST